MKLIVLGLCHDKEDPGAVTKAGLAERDIAYIINKALRSELLEEGLLTLLLDKGNLDERIEAINDLAKVTTVDLAVEVHMNNHEDPQREGFFCMTWHSSHTAKRVAEKIAGQLRYLKRKDLGLNQVDHARRWIDHHWEYGSAPSVAWLEDVRCSSLIVEVCHLSNEKEADWIENLDNRILVGEAIAQGIIEHFREV